MPDDVSLLVNGRRYLGWKQVTITRSIEAIAGSFSITLTDRWAEDMEPWPIIPGDACTVSIGGDIVLTGYVDSSVPSFSGAQERQLTVAGRDIAGDLVDCSENIKPGELLGVTALDVAKRVAQPFGVPVRATVDVGEPFRVFSIQPGETAFETISRACQKRSLLPISLPSGLMLLTQSGRGRTGDALVQGENILSMSARHSMNNRHSLYTVKSQGFSLAKIWQGKDASQMIATSSDMAVPRFRPKTFIESGDTSVAELKKRADWEASTRAAKGTTASISVQGWRQSTGKLWPVNSIVSVKAPAIQVERRMLITGISYQLSESGSITAMNLTRPDAFLPQPLKPENEIVKPILGGF